MTDLVERIRAALDAEEARLRALPPFPWKLDPDDDEAVLAADDIQVAEAFALSSNQTRLVAAHIALHDPERELRMVAAHRKILDLHHDVEHPEYPDCCAECGNTYPCATVLTLANALQVEA